MTRRKILVVMGFPFLRICHRTHKGTPNDTIRAPQSVCRVMPRASPVVLMVADRLADCGPGSLVKLWRSEPSARPDYARSSF